MVIGFDTETHLIRRGLLIPPVVCLSLAGDGPRPAWLPPAGPNARYVEPPPETGATWALVVGRDEARTLGPHVLASSTLAAANAAFDLLGLATHCGWDLDAVFGAYAEDRVQDVACVDRVRAIAEGERTPDGRLPNASLAALVERHFAVALSGKARAEGEEDPWRLRYAELEGVPVALWPADAANYAGWDAAWHFAVAVAQQTAPSVGPGCADGLPPAWEREPRAAFALHLAAAWGLRTDPETVAEVQRRWGLLIERSTFAGQVGGWVRGSGGAALPPADRVPHLQRVYDLCGAPPGSYTGRGKVSTSVAAVRTAIALRPPYDATAAEIEALRAAQSALRPTADAGREESLDRAALQRVVETGYAAMGLPVPETEKGATRTDRGTLTRLARSDYAPPELQAYSAGLSAGKARSVWGPALEAGTHVPLTSRPVHVVATGRAAWSDPPLQQPPREGWPDPDAPSLGKLGVRECFVPTPGFLYASADYGTAELVALSQIHLWLGLDDSMAVALRDGQDLHVRLAAELLDTPYPDAWARYLAGDPEVKQARQLAKAANFGYPGGLAVRTFTDYAYTTYRLEISEEAARKLRAAWFAAWPAQRGYFDWIQRQLEAGGGTFQAVQFVSERRRGGCGYTDGANTHFQGLVADLAKDAFWRVQREAWTGRKPEDGGPSPLAGSAALLLLHDEIMIEAPEDTAPEAADRLSEVMLEAARDHIPDVPMQAKPSLSRRWSKDTASVRDPATGRLVPA